MQYLQRYRETTESPSLPTINLLLSIPTFYRSLPFRTNERTDPL
jgi:hypothetical protein